MAVNNGNLRSRSDSRSRSQEKVRKRFNNRQGALNYGFLYGYLLALSGGRLFYCFLLLRVFFVQFFQFYLVTLRSLFFLRVFGVQALYLLVRLLFQPVLFNLKDGACNSVCRFQKEVL